MHKFILTVIFILLLPFIAIAQEKADKPNVDKADKAEKVEQRKIPLSPEESRLFTQLKMQAEVDEQRARASAAEWRAYFLELNIKYKIDLEKWEFNFNQMGWVEKQGQAAPVTGEQGQPK